MNDKAEEIRQRMLQVRNDIDEDVDELVVVAKTFVDWKEYVRSAPWATAGLACALGFLVVPAKKKALPFDEALKQFGDSNATTAFVSAEKPSLLRVAAGKLAATTMRIAAGHVAKHASALLSGQPGLNSGQVPFSRQCREIESHDSTH